MQISEQLVQVRNDEDADIEVDTTTEYREKVERHAVMLGEIHAVAQLLQIRDRTLAMLYESVGMLTDAPREQKNVPRAPLYKCQLGNKKIVPNASIVDYPSFEPGVVKLQWGQEEKLIRDKKRALNGLLNQER